MKGKSEQRQQREKCWKKKSIKKVTGQKQKMNVFCLIFLRFEVKREKDSNSFKNNGKYHGFFRAHIVLKKKKNKRTETE